MKITFYGQLADIAGRELVLTPISPCTVGELRELLLATHPAMASLLRDKRVRVCVGSIIVDDDYSVSSLDEVEFLAPVSGG